MISFPNAKINIGLNIVAKRADGYHDLESCFYPIPWCDVLEIIPSEELTFTSSGLAIPGSQESNLCIKAFELLKERFNVGNVNIHLHKVIPMGAGLGGGSADGAFTLRMLNSIFSLGLSIPELQPLANQLGADCPFFIENKPSYVTGTGDCFQPCNVDLKGNFLVLKNPEIHISTKEAFANIKPKPSQNSLKEILANKPISDWHQQVVNDFEKSVFPNHLEIEQIKNDFIGQGALYASMTGTGSTVYGIFEKDPELQGVECFRL
ncbi:MAG: 4-(cytidine 5'-diphospho)-2-C-methyl-D-erythritol kinase [Cyclobacteriaceae bacterium]